MGISDVRGAEPPVEGGGAGPRTEPGARPPDAASAVPGRGPLPPVAWRPVAAVAALTGLVRVLTNPLFDHGGDELYFLAVGERYLGSTWADQPPLVPALAGAMDALASGSQTVLRLPAVLAVVAALVLTALLARELGGGRRAQVLAALVFATSSFFSLGSRMNAHPFEVLTWTAAILLLVMWLNRRDDRFLLGVGAVTAVGLQVSLHFLEFWAVAVVVTLACGPRELLRRPMLWVAGAVSVLSLVPTVLWSAANGWRHLERVGQTSSEGDPFVNRVALLPMSLVYAGFVVAAALLLYGAWRLLRSPELRPYRFLGWFVVGLVVLYIAANGKGYYTMGLFPLCWAAASVELLRRPRPKWAKGVFWAALAVSTVITLAPTLAADTMVPHWRQQVAAVFDVHERLEPARRSATAVVSHQYGLATAIDRYGPSHGVSRAYSPEGGYWYFGRPPESATNAIYIGSDRADLLQYFDDVRPAGRVPDGDWLERGSAGEPIWLCSGLRKPWAETWESMRRVQLSGQTGHGSDGKSIR
ncbi:glycosyltransferase family 39 protein [Spirillospora sp. NPDC052242]